VTVKTYRDMLTEYAVHPEAKSNAPHGDASGRQTAGILSRRPVTARAISYIGKEANRLDEVQFGLVERSNETLSVYGDTAQAALLDWALPILRRLGVREVARRTGHSLGAVHAVLHGHAIPRSTTMVRYLACALAACPSATPGRTSSPDSR
jgi:hypothetical protein